MSDSATAFQELVEVIRTLRSPEGCPWDRKQTPDTTRAHFLEESYELADAIIAADPEAVREECGDVLFLSLFLINLYEEAGHFRLVDVLEENIAKMVGRHPHVFDKESTLGASGVDVDSVLSNWEKIKAGEKNKKQRRSLLDGIPASLPPLLQAMSLQKKAARAGFDWPDVSSTFAKLKEEMAELEEAINEEHSREYLEEETGDLLFSIINLARKLEIDPEKSLAATNHKFTTRFQYIEQKLEEKNKKAVDTPLEELDALWEMAKKEL